MLTIVKLNWVNFLIQWLQKLAIIRLMTNICMNLHKSNAVKYKRLKTVLNNSSLDWKTNNSDYLR